MTSSHHIPYMYNRSRSYSPRPWRRHDSDRDLQNWLDYRTVALSSEKPSPSLNLSRPTYSNYSTTLPSRNYSPRPWSKTQPAEKQSKGWFGSFRSGDKTLPKPNVEQPGVQLQGLFVSRSPSPNPSRPKFERLETPQSELEQWFKDRDSPQKRHNNTIPQVQTPEPELQELTYVYEPPSPPTPPPQPERQLISGIQESGIQWDLTPKKLKYGVMGGSVELNYQGGISSPVHPAKTNRRSSSAQNARPDPRTAVCTIRKPKSTSWWDWLPSCPLTSKKKKPCWQNKQPMKKNNRRRSRSAASFPFNMPPLSWMVGSSGRRVSTGCGSCQVANYGGRWVNSSRNPCLERSLPPKAVGCRR